MINEYLNRVQLTKAENTHSTHSKVLRYWFPTGQMDLTPAYIMKKLAEWRKAGISQNTIVTRLNVLNQLLTFLKTKKVAVPDRDELEDIIKAVKPQKKIPTVATAEQVEAVMEAISDPKYKAIVAILFYGGLRVSEAVGLDMADYNEGRLHIKDTKNHEERLVDLHPVARELVERYVANYRYGTAPALFTTTHGRISKNVVQRQVAAYSAKLGFDLSCHTFRHGAGTFLLDNGVNLRAIQEFLGHKSITTTQRYTHVTKAARQEITTAFNKAKKGGSVARQIDLFRN